MERDFRNRQWRAVSGVARSWVWYDISALTHGEKVQSACGAVWTPRVVRFDLPGSMLLKSRTGWPAWRKGLFWICRNA